MAVIVTDNRTIRNEADANTGWTGTTTLLTADPDPVEATGCLGATVGAEIFDSFHTAAATSLTNKIVYCWAYPRGVIGLRNSANGGLMVTLGDGTNRAAYKVAGADVAGFRHDLGPTPWQCIVLDTSNLPASPLSRLGVAANLNLAAVTQVGTTVNSLVAAPGMAATYIVDIIRIFDPTLNDGCALTITGGTSGTPGKFSEIATEDASTANGKAHGVVRELAAGAFGVQAPLRFGNAVGTDSSWFEDKNVSMIFESRGFTTTRYKIHVVDNGVGTTTFLLGTKAGTGDDATGVEGCSLISPSGIGASLQASSSLIHKVGIYGSTISGFTNGITLSSDATKAPTHEVLGSTISECGIFDPGRVVVRNCNIVGWTGLVENAAILWGANADVKRCNVTSAGAGHGVKITTPGTYTFDGILFSGYGLTGTNDAAVYNNSSGSVTINVVGGGNTPTYRNGTSASTTVNANVSITITGLQNPSEVRVFNFGTTTEIAGQENVTVGSYTFSVGSGVAVDISILALGYQNFRILNYSTTADASIPVQQQVDRQYFNPL
jgi:hypothetical protein